MKTKLTYAAAVLSATVSFAAPASAADKTEIAVSRFFGSCEADYGDVVDASQANGECGIVTALINEYNATSDTYVVKEEVVEWPGYDQFTARLRAGNPPVLHVMHATALPDYQSRDLIASIGDDLAAAGVDLSDMTDAAANGVTIDGKIYGMPFDTVSWLWHINTNMFEEAGLMKDGMPVLPSSPEELLEHARLIKEKTGKPYFVQAESGNMQAVARNLFTLMFQQNGEMFADPSTLTLDGPEVRNYLELFKTLRDEDLSTRDLDYAASTQGFPNGDGAVYIMGTWLIDTYNEESKKADRPLSGGYAVVPFPTLYDNAGLWSNGHVWVMPEQDLSAEEKAAAIDFLKFLWDNNFEWSRTGHLPIRKSIIDSDAFKSLPHRDTIGDVAADAKLLPSDVKRQFFMMDIFGEEMAAAYKGQKTIDDAIAETERRINDLLARAK